MRKIALLLALALVPLAGCLGDDDADLPDDLPGDAQVTDDSIVLPWGLSDCSTFVAIAPVTTDSIAPYLPEGFTSVSMESIVGTPTPELIGEANLGIEILDCDNGIGLDGELGPTAYASYFTQVVPPADLQSDVDMYFVKFDVLIPDEDRRELLQGHGIPAVPGSTSVNLLQGQDTTWIGAATATMDAQAFSIGGVGANPLGETTSFIEFTDTPTGLVQWRTTVESSEVALGPLLVRSPDNGLFADVVGLPVTPAAGFMGMASFSDSTITIPR